MQKLALLVGILFAVGCQTTIDPKDLAERLKTFPLADGKTAEGKTTITFESVACPTGMPARAGEKFTCTAKLHDGDALDLDVEMTGSTAYRATTKARIIFQSAVGDALEKKIHQHADIACPEIAFVAKPGKTWVCDVTVQGKTQRVTLGVMQDGDNYEILKVE